MIRPGFEERLADFDLESLSTQAATVYAVDEELNLAFFNPAWLDFADENGGEPAVRRDWGLGRHVLEACAGPVRGFYSDAYTSALYRAEIWEHDYQCSSPDAFRMFHQTVYPLREHGGLLVVNALVVERPHGAGGAPDPEPAYRNADGILTQCCHCRKVRHDRVAERWDWVPDWVAETPPQTSHGLCQVCLDHHYPEIRV